MKLLLRLVLIVVAAAAVSGAWLFRHEILRRVRPASERGAGPADGSPGARALARARDKIDSLHGWSADSVVLTPDEAASLFYESLPAGARRRLDSVRVTLETGSIRVTGLLETAAVPREKLGPLAGALKPYERITAEGPVSVRKAGEATWRVEALTLRGITLPEAASRELLGRALAGADDGRVTMALPPGVADLHIRPGGVALFPKGAL